MQKPAGAKRRLDDPGLGAETRAGRRAARRAALRIDTVGRRRALKELVAWQVAVEAGEVQDE